MESSLKKRYIIKLFANIISAIIGAVMVAIVPKALGPVVYGQFVYLQNFFQQLLGFLDMGSSLAFFTKLSARNDRKELLTFYFTYVLIIFLCLGSFIFFLDTFSMNNTIIPNITMKYVYLGFLFGFFTWVSELYIKISDAYALTVSVEIIKIIHKIFSLFLIFFFIYKLSFDLEMYFYFYYISLLSFILILSWLFIKKGILKNILNFEFSILNLTKEFFSYCHPLVVYSVISILMSLFDLWLLQKISGSEQTGFYGLAYSLAAMCFLFTSAMTPIITREFSKSYEEKNLIQMQKIFTRYVPMLYSIAAYFAIFISFQSENVLKIFTDERFQGAFPILVIMAFYPIHQTYGQLSGSIFHATGQTKLYRNIGLYIQPIGLISSLLLIYVFELGGLGLALKMILIQFIGVNIQLYFNAKLLGLNFQNLLLHQGYSIIFFGLLAFVINFFVSVESNISDFLISGFMYTILVIIFGYIFPQVFATTKDEIKENLYKVKQYVTQK